MLIIAIENFIFFSTALALVAFLIASLARKVTDCGQERLHPHTLTRLYEAAVVLPPMIAAWLVAASLLPETWLGEAAFDAAHPAPLHHLHLLGDLTSAVEPVLAYSTLSLAAGIALFSAWSSVRAYSRVGRIIEQLEAKAPPPPPEQLTLATATAAQHGLDVGLVMSHYPFSFVWGFRHSKLVLSSGLLHTLTPEQLCGVLKHEAAHHARRDNLMKLALSVTSYASLAFPLSRLVLRWRDEQVEMVCDEVAAVHTSAPLEIAEALIKLRRTFTTVGHISVGSATSSFVPHQARGFERRVQRLIDLSDTLPSSEQALALSRTHQGRVLVFAALLALTLIALSVISPLAVHRTTEFLIHFLK